MKQLVCPKCLRSMHVTTNTTAWCSHGRPETRFNRPVLMVPVEELAKENA